MRLILPKANLSFRRIQALASASLAPAASISSSDTRP